MRPPDVVGIGAQKAGTTWWWELLLAHPQFSPPVDGIKEQHHFDMFVRAPFDDRAIANYRARFAAPPEQRTGEWTPRYFSDHWVAPLLRRAAPDAKLVVVLRDPVERYRSGVAHVVQRGGVFDASAANDAFGRGLYGLHLERWLRHWPRNQLLVLQYEQCCRDPAANLRRTYEFVGLDPVRLPRRLRRRANVTTARVTLSAEERESLSIAYLDDVRRLLALVDDIERHAVADVPWSRPVTAAPFFVVGCARSGTTLLRLMLDSHPRLAVPPESHFIPRLAPSDLNRPFDVERILEHPQVRLWDVDGDDVRATAAELHATTYAQQVDALFTTYARSEGKLRWADKTPGYVEHLPQLAALFPTARFVHLIRDGREVATSLAEWPWGPASPIAGAFWWRRKVRAGRRAGALLGPERYLELRLEDLVHDPEGELRRLCAFISEEFDAAMLDYPRTAEEWMRRPQETYMAFTHPHLTKPPTAGLRDWRRGLSGSDQEAIEAACAPLLRELGYATTTTRRVALVRAYRLRYQSALRTLHRDIAARLRPRTSEV